jgi:ADP-ribose pyrophosphatase YjhB (NUDIX family)
MSNQLPVRRYAAAGGVVIDAQGERVLTLVRLGRLGPDGLPEVRLPKGHIEAGESREQAASRGHEEAGLASVQILADLGRQTVEFDWKGVHTVRDESYFLMVPSDGGGSGQPEVQFEVEWLPWGEALARLTFDAEREWLKRARTAWNRQLADKSPAEPRRS